MESPIAGELAAFVSRLIPYPPSSTRPSPRSTRPAAVRTNLTEFGTSVARYVWGEVGAGPGIPTGRRPSGRPPQLEPGQGWAISCGAVAGETLGSSATAAARRGNEVTTMPTLISVNVGLPRDVEWQGRTVHTGVWKSPVVGPRMVRPLNIDGDGQGDLAGHGGEQRAVLVYQLDSYRYWAKELGRDDLRPGHFGENFTVEGLSDDEVCIGDRYRICLLYTSPSPRD